MTLVTPGTTSHGTPADAQASISSPPATEDGGVAALEPHHVSSGLGVFDHQLLDPALPGLHVVARALADVDDLGSGRRLGEKFRRRQTIVQHDIGGL